MAVSGDRRRIAQWACAKKVSDFDWISIVLGREACLFDGPISENETRSLGQGRFAAPCSGSLSESGSWIPRPSQAVEQLTP